MLIQNLQTQITENKKQTEQIIEQKVNTALNSQHVNGSTHSTFSLAGDSLFPEKSGAISETVK